MLEAKYFRDYKHNYLILPCGSEQTDRSYQCRVLTANKFKEILGCSLRHVNGEVYFYYDISSRTTLESLYRGRQLSFEQVKELFKQLYDIYRMLGDYFMDETKLVLLPEHIYYDLSRNKYMGLYYPDYEEDRPYEPLMDYLLEHMDSQDERLADAIYQIYERTEERTFSLCDALRLLEEQKETGTDKENEEQKKDAFVANPDPVSATAFLAGEDSGWDEGNLQTEKKIRPAVSEKKNGFSAFLMVLAVLGIAGIAFVYGYYELSDEEMMTLFGCGALMGVCFLAGLAGVLRGGGKKEKTHKMPEPFLQEEKYLSESKPVSLEGVLYKEAELGLEKPVKKNEEGLREEENFGNTVFFDNTGIGECKLYALDRKNKRHIALTKFPYTVGKMIGCVDCVLEDDSVSRIHARFEKEGDTIRLIDMNSTNGTYKNGLRMQPQESVEIEPGDEIRFGNLNYCYR